MIDVTDFCEDKPCTPIPGKVLNPEIWYEGTCIGIRQTGGPVMIHKQFFVYMNKHGGRRIIKIHDDEFARGVRASAYNP
jgi:hypothetical protein